jgi:hypothetical protein
LLLSGEPYAAGAGGAEGTVGVRGISVEYEYVLSSIDSSSRAASADVIFPSSSIFKTASFSLAINKPFLP